MGALIIGIIFLIIFPLGKKEVEKLQAGLQSKADVETEPEVVTLEKKE